ncbi:hypothetical protein HRbin02_01213 [Candidatus Calditenuaceae archaeon HR02]|nr:hypothetical protein HRbin02_01213 [Candidatus Calditenuaceae archaeon HR02]
MEKVRASIPRKKCLIELTIKMIQYHMDEKEKGRPVRRFVICRREISAGV